MLSNMPGMVMLSVDDGIEKDKIDKLIRDFENILEENTKNFPPKIIRAKLPGSVYILSDPEKIIIGYVPHKGSTLRYIKQEKNILPSHFQRDLIMQLDADDSSIAVLPKHALDLEGDARNSALIPSVTDYITRSIGDFQMASGISAFSPIFGPNKYPVQDNLIFVLMPFDEALTKLYNASVKPAIEDGCNMVCRRADDIKSTNPIMEDIWKSICEARLIIADLTGFNPNVMYELGIAHTLGKPTLLIYQEKDTENKFPFDLAHIRRINYQDTAAGGEELKVELVQLINTMISFSA